jgi:membrane protease YdiL (CAAX protease family)
MRGLITFLLVSFCSASLLDLAFYSYSQGLNQLFLSLLLTLWGFLRMYTPTLGVIVALILSRENLRVIESYINFSWRSLKYFLLAPLYAYFSSATFLLLAHAMGLLDIDGLLQLISSSSGVTKELASVILMVQVIVAYPAALTINSIAALGEEIGWRGYLFRQLGGNFGLKSILLVGTIWGLWHSTAIALLGHNYPLLRASGIPLFILFCISSSIAMLKLTEASGSILPPVSLHGGLNALWGLAAYSTKFRGVENELYGGLGVLGIISLFIASVSTVAILKKYEARAKAEEKLES